MKLTSKTFLGVLEKVFPIYCGSYALNRAHYCLGTEGRVRGFRKTHIRSPNSPFYDYSSHLLRGIQEACTNG